MNSLPERRFGVCQTLTSVEGKKAGSKSLGQHRIPRGTNLLKPAVAVWMPQKISVSACPQIWLFCEDRSFPLIVQRLSTVAGISSQSIGSTTPLPVVASSRNKRSHDYPPVTLCVFSGTTGAKEAITERGNLRHPEYWLQCPIPDLQTTYRRIQARPPTGWLHSLRIVRFRSIENQDRALQAAEASR